MINVEPSFVLYALLLDPGCCLRAHITLFGLVEPGEKKKQKKRKRAIGGRLEASRRWDAVWWCRPACYCGPVGPPRGTPPQGDVVIDVGAHVGLFAAHIGALYPGVQVYSVEPLPRNYKYLVLNLRRAKLLSRVTPINLAIGVCVCMCVSQCLFFFERRLALTS